MAIKAHFLALWSYTPEAHITTFAHQLDQLQVKCEEYEVMLPNDNKVDNCVDQMYACDLFKEKLLDKWKDNADKLWMATQPHFMRQFNKERRNMKRNNSQKNYGISAVFLEDPQTHTPNPPQVGATTTMSLTDIQAMMKQLAPSATVQAATVAILSTRNNGGGGD